MRNPLRAKVNQYSFSPNDPPKSQAASPKKADHRRPPRLPPKTTVPTSDLYYDYGSEPPSEDPEKCSTCYYESDEGAPSSRDSDSSHESRRHQVRRRDEHTFGHFTEPLEDGPIETDDAQEPLIQLRILVMICVYLSPLVTGYSASLVSQGYEDLEDAKVSGATFISNDDDAFSFSISPMHFVLLGTIFGSASLFPLLYFGRLKILALAAALQFFSSLLLLFFDNASPWAPSTAQFATGTALAIHVPVQQLYVAETSPSRRRHSLAVLSLLLLATGTAMPRLLEMAFPRESLSVPHLVAVAFVFMATGFCHPETPRFFISKSRRADCVNSLQWLRGRSKDVGPEYATLVEARVSLNAMLDEETKQSHTKRETSVIWPQGKLFIRSSIYVPTLTSLAVLTLRSLCGAVSISYLLKNSFNPNKKDKTEEEREADQESSSPWDMRDIILFLEVACPLITLVTLRFFRVGRKLLLLVSTATMTMAMLFLAVLAHIGDNLILDEESSFRWTLPFVCLIYLFAYYIGMGPLSWIGAVELVPSPVLEPSLAVSCSCHWALQLALSLSMVSLVDTVGLLGLFWMHAIVSGLAYGFILILVPDFRHDEIALEAVELHFAEMAEERRAKNEEKRMRDLEQERRKTRAVKEQEQMERYLEMQRRRQQGQGLSKFC